MGKQLSRFCEELARLAPQVNLKRDSDIAFEGPAMVVGRHNNIAYCAVPTNKMLPLFLDAMNPAGEMPNKRTDDFEKQIEQIDLPAAFKLYVADQCPHCPQVIRRIQDIAAGTPLVRLKIINAEVSPEQARSDHIRSVPTLVLDDQFRWVGRVNLREIFKICSHRDPSKLSVDSLKQLVESGDAARVAIMMVESDQIFPAFVELLTHSRWSVRLGGMVAAEYLADEAPELALGLCRRLWDRFTELSPQIQGDATHLFGLVDTDVTREYLLKITSGAFHGDVKEAATEVLADM